jgi:hypothetical protein
MEEVAKAESVHAVAVGQLAITSGVSTGNGATALLSL